MDKQEDILSFLDLLDLDEELIDARLKSLMVRNNLTTKHFKSVIQLLQYKNLINCQEGTDCENNDELDFIVRLLGNVNNDNVDYVCKIVFIVLCLNNSNIVSKSEHLIQQILLNINFQTDSNSSEGEVHSDTLINLKICRSILDAIISKNEKLCLLCLEAPLEKLLDSTDEKLKIYFLTNIVPKLFEGVVEYDILDRVWNHITQLKGDGKENALKILSCLSDYYLPFPDGEGNMKYESGIIFLNDFWDLVLFGMTSEDATIRKIAVYLSKRAIDYVIVAKKDINIVSESHILFSWKKNDSKTLKNMWDNYFVLIDSLEEKQSNIVLPSLRLFETIYIEPCWMNAAFNIGLKHDNSQVRLKCIEYKLKTGIKSQSEALVVLEAINDINIYEDSTTYNALKSKIKDLLTVEISCIEILKAIPLVKWSPVPLYHITDILANLKSKISHNNFNIIMDILKVPCNNVHLREGVYINLVQFVTECCEFDHEEIASIISITQLQSLSNIHFQNLIKKISLKTAEKKFKCLKTLSENVSNIDYLLGLSLHNDAMNILFNIINEKGSKINEILKRQYSDKKECLNEVLFITHMEEAANSLTITQNIEGLQEILSKHKKTILQYILSLFSNDITLSIEEVSSLLEYSGYEDNDLEDILTQLYKTSILFLMSNPELNKAVLSILTIKMLCNNVILLNSKYRAEMLSLKTFLEIILNLKFNISQNESVGRMKNMFYETACEITYSLMHTGGIYCVKDLITYIENMLECGGYGCLIWILRIVKNIHIPLVDRAELNIVQFLNRVWKEIEELKSNNQYLPCIEEFVGIVTHEDIVKNAMYNNVVTLYCNRIIENGPIQTNPLYYLIERLKTFNVEDCGHLVLVLCEILLYSPVMRKDQRIINNLTVEILNKYERLERCMHFNFEVQHSAIEILSKINNEATLITISKFITNKVTETFKNKQRYHGNSQLHKTLLIALQHLLLITLKCKNGLDWLLDWSIDLLVKLPHQPSVRICLEWLITLYFYMEKTHISDEVLHLLKSKNVPLTSQFFVTYWLLKRKILDKTYDEDEFNFVLDFLLSHTMGQLFNVRLHSQYLATSLRKMVEKPTKFDYTLAVINKTFNESQNDKSYVKLKSDYFANSFDIVINLHPHFIYDLLPKYCGIDCEKSFNRDNVFWVYVQRDLVVADVFKAVWESRDKEIECVEFDCNRVGGNEVTEDVESTGTIQKKYIPWKNMSDIDVYADVKKSENKGDLIVVASLIDKLPNLGGMARTSEVFAVKTYVVDSLRHLTDKQFQGLSVSAERWINIEEVRPGRALKEYLLQKKTEGYSVVAAEQTSTSTKLQTFKFPRKTLLLLGHEKEGVPCDLLPIMDHCVEIPQQGLVRSLNVHVTAAIFIWEYARQNIL